MSNPQLEVHDTCACGAQMIARGDEAYSVHVRHREWLEAHDVCRLRFEEEIRHSPPVPPDDLAAPERPSCSHTVSLTDPNKPPYDEHALRASDLPKQQW